MFRCKRNRVKKTYYEELFNEKKIKQTWSVVTKVLSKMEKRSRLEVKSIINYDRIDTDSFLISKQ